LTPALQTILILLTLLQLKHMFADFFMQTPKMLGARHVYAHIGRVQHAGLHAVFSAGIFAALGAPIGFTVVLCLVEFIVHFHIDWVKGKHSESVQDVPEDAAYWRAFGVDQLMHQLTYVAMIWAYITYTF